MQSFENISGQQTNQKAIWIKLEVCDKFTTFFWKISLILTARLKFNYCQTFRTNRYPKKNRSDIGWKHLHVWDIFQSRPGYQPSPVVRNSSRQRLYPQPDENQNHAHSTRRGPPSKITPRELQQLIQEKHKTIKPCIVEEFTCLCSTLTSFPSIQSSFRWLVIKSCSLLNVCPRQVKFRLLSESNAWFLHGLLWQS